MNITEFADRYVGAEGAVEGVGPATREFAEAFGVEPERAELMLAARLWVDTDPASGGRGLIRGRDPAAGGALRLRNRLLIAGASPLVFGNVKTLVVPHASVGRYDLVVLDPGMPPSAEPIVVEILMSEYIRDQDRLDRIYNLDWLPFPAIGRRDVTSLVEAAMLEVGTRRPYAALVVPAPAFVPMTTQPCLGIRAVGEEVVGTVGVAAVTDVGEWVLTTARHAVIDRDDLYVSGHLTSVVGSSEILDCALLSHPYQVHVGALYGGALTVTPRTLEFATFEGARSGPTSTIVRSFDMRLMSAVRNTALCVLTDADTMGGDSGAGLYDSDGKLIGFCSERTELGAPFECTSWIWAQQVLDMMRLTPSKG